VVRSYLFSPLFLFSSPSCFHRPRLPKIKAWIDENNPGDLLIPFSVALEERLAPMSDEEKKEEEEKVGATSNLGKITQAGYAALDVRLFHIHFQGDNNEIPCHF
jgi:ribosome-binding ATPase YchF (GTP1/OBG family)